ncbi:MAG: replicative DNA helicase [Lachnospiraceae bacterium]|nr:replicative DNA helicase [Lachnospiraceae bacterium]
MEEVVVRKVMPHSTESEQSVLGAMLMDSQAIISAGEILTGEDFYNKQYGVIFDAMQELQTSGRPVDLITLQDLLKEKNVPPEVSSLTYVKEFIERVPTSANVKSYAEIVREKSVLRRMIRANDDISTLCYSGKEKLDVILDTAEKKVFDVVKRRGSTDFVPIDEVVMNVLDNIEKAGKVKGNTTGVPTGFTDLDYDTAGFQPSDLILIAARPSMGKTAFALNIALNAAIKEKKRVALFDLEMSKESLVNRLFAMQSKVDAKKLRTGDLNTAEWEMLSAGAAEVAKSFIVIDDNAGITPAELRSKCRKLQLEKGLDMIIIDYLQLMTNGGKTDSRQQEVSDISRSLKLLARELNVPVVALSQLSRKVEERTDKRPMLSDLRESGAIEQDADVVMFLYREDYYKKDTENTNVTEVIIAKQRNGPVGTVKLAWLPEFMLFKNLTKGNN